VRRWFDTQLVIRIEAVRGELSLQEAGRAGVDPYRDLPYWLVVLGDPTSTDPWAWRINGHHLLGRPPRWATRSAAYIDHDLAEVS
jgi:hypothetical protein